MTQEAELQFSTTKQALIWTNVLNEPLDVLFHALSAAILIRDLHASFVQIAVYTMCKPLVALFSLYWSIYLQQRPHRLIKSILITGFLSRLPFLFVPFITNPWLFILCTSSYMTLSRGGMPSWMEVLKKNLPSDVRTKTFSWSSSVSYVEGIIIGISFGFLLDIAPMAWKLLFPITAIIGMTSLCVQAKIPESSTQVEARAPASCTDQLLAPWKTTYTLLKTRSDFRFFQLGFMCAGAGLMIIAPVIPIFLVQYLHLSFTEIATANTIAKGLGFAIASPFWSQLLHRQGIIFTSAWVFASVAVYPILLIFGIFDISFVYIALLWYGVAQAGSHLSWHLSGAFFAKGEPSQSFSDVNVLAVGVRGAVMPPLGGALCTLVGPMAVFVICAMLCVTPAYFFLRGEKMRANIKKFIEFFSLSS